MICRKCGAFFPNHIKIDGRRHTLNRRRFCLECSPFGQHNTKQLDREEYQCSKCGDKNPEHFPKGRYTECKKCRTRYNKKTIRHNKAKGIEYLGGKCMCCGYARGLSAFDFHHVNPENKDSNFRTHSYWSWERFKNELEGCLLLCSNCHRLLHNGEITYGDFEFIPEDKLKLINDIGA